MLPHTNTVIIICGPTAVGKTAVAIQLARHFKTKIISADSRQCYQELNIGVAKPSPVELDTVPHYFINSHTIHHDVNAVVFEGYALNACAEIFNKNEIAVMVGGTGLYIKAFCEGFDNIPVTPAEIREDINTNYRQHGLDWLQSEVQKKDLTFWKTAEQKNPHRLIRALEVVSATGKSIIDFKTGEKLERPFSIIKVGLNMPKEKLNGNINFRVEKMIEDGLVEEVKALQTFQHLRALQTVGYKELFQYFNNEITLEGAISNIKTNTRQYAKRQVTWFRKEDVKWFEMQDCVESDIASFINEKV